MNKEPRPGVKYVRNELEDENYQLETGLIFALVRSTRVRRRSGGRCEDVAVILRLEDAPPSPGNALIVNRFGHKGFKHVKVGAQITVDVVPSRRLRRNAALLPDMCHFLTNLGDEADITSQHER